MRSASSRCRSSPPPRPVQPLLDALDAPVHDLLDALGEHALGLAREPLDRQVELAAEPARRLLAGGADRRVELLRRRLGVARRLARDRSASCSSCRCSTSPSRGRDPLHRLGLLALDLLLQLALAQPQALGELLQRLRRSIAACCLELGRAPRRRPPPPPAASSSRSLAASRALLLDRRLEPLGVLRRSAPRSAASAARWRCAIRASSSAELSWSPLEVGRPARRPRCSTLRWAAVERLGELRGGVALALGDVARAAPRRSAAPPRRARRATPTRASASVCSSSAARSSTSRATTSSNAALPRAISSSSVRVARASAAERDQRGDGSAASATSAATSATTAAAVTLLG